MNTNTNGNKMEDVSTLPHSIGIYCFTDHESKVVYANSCSDVQKGMGRHQEKLSRGQHVNRDFLNSYLCGNLTATHHVSKDWDEVNEMLSTLTKNSGYTLVRL